MSHDLNQFKQDLILSNIHFEEDVDLSAFSYMRTGGKARLITYPGTKDDFARTLALASSNGVQFKVIGNTSNLLFLDGVDYSCLICTTRLNKMHLEGAGKVIVAETGVMVPDLARFALFHSLSGMEGLEGIPGTLGGGIFMNAGAYGFEIRDYLESIETVDATGNFRTYTAADAGLTHRSSIFRKSKQDIFVYSCRFALKPGNERSIYSKMELLHAKRHRYQDFMYPNLGSIFSGSPYRAMARKDSQFGVALRLFLLLGYKLNVLGRESSINRRWINDLAVKRFGLKYDKQPFSDKTINCLVNRGQGTSEMVRYVREMESIIDGQAPLENEVVEGF